MRIRPARIILSMDRDRQYTPFRQAYAQAIEAYQEAVNISRNTEDVTYFFAAAYEESELYELSRQQCLEVLERNRKSFEANFRLAPSS